MTGGVLLSSQSLEDELPDLENLGGPADKRPPALLRVAAGIGSLEMGVEEVQGRIPEINFGVKYALITQLVNGT